MAERDRTVWLPTFGAPNAYIGFVPDARSWGCVMSRLSADEPYPAAEQGRVTVLSNTRTGALTLLVTLPPQGKRTDAQIAALVAHEASHLVDFLFEAMAERAPGGEVRAYWIQNLVQDLLVAYWGARRRVKR